MWNWLGVGMTATLVAARTFLKKSEQPRKRFKVILTVYENTDDGPDVVLAQQEIVGEDCNGKGHYRFYRPDGQFYNLRLTDGDYRIIRQWVPV